MASLSGLKQIGQKDWRMNDVKASRSGNTKIPRLITNILHPWVVLVPVMALAAYQAVREPFDCIKWTLLALVPALISPLIYAKVKSTMLSRNGSPQKISRSLFRDNPVQLLIMAGLFGIPAALILYFLSAPRNLLIIILGVTTVMFVIALVNFTYRASFHLAMVTSMLTSLWFLFGNISLFAFLLLPILCYSRYRLGAHTTLQMVAGFLIGLAVSIVVFYVFGLTP